MANTSTVSGEIDHFHRLKVVILGDGTTGKTSLAKRFAQNAYSAAYEQTIGIDFFIQRFELRENIYVTLHVWDIGGQTIGGSMLQTYLAGANIVLLVYDVTNYSTFANIKDWLREVYKVFGDNRNKNNYPIVCLVANKTDLDYKANISQEKHENFCRENNLEGSHLSAKINDNVELCFKRLAALALKITLPKNETDKWKNIVKAVVMEEPLKTDTVGGKEVYVNQSKSVTCNIQ